MGCFVWDMMRDLSSPTRAEPMPYTVEIWNTSPEPPGKSQGEFIFVSDF